MWKLLGRGKRAAVLDLKTEPTASTTMRRLVDSADVLIENFRPGTLERLGLDPVDLLERNPGLVDPAHHRLRPGRSRTPGRPGFATMAEAMSGFAAINGEPDGAPLLPPIALTDEVTALAGAFTVMVALRHRDRTGEGQVVDINLLETMLQLMGALPSANAHLGYLQPRLGSGIPYTVPRGTYQCADGRWVAISTSAESIARAGDGAARRGRRPALRDVRGPGRAPRRARRDRRGLGRRPGRRPRCSRRSRRREAAIAPVYSMADLLADPAHRGARGDRRGRRRPDAGAARPALEDAGRGPSRRPRRSAPTPTRSSRTSGRPRPRSRRPDARRPEECRSRDPPSRAGPQRLLGTSLRAFCTTRRGFSRASCGQRVDMRRGSGENRIAAICRRRRPVRRRHRTGYECRSGSTMLEGGTVSSSHERGSGRAGPGPDRADALRRDRPGTPGRGRAALEGRRRVAALDLGGLRRAGRPASPASLRDLGVGRGDRVVLMMRNRPEFHVADVAVLLLGATPISIYNSSAAGAGPVPRRATARRRSRSSRTTASSTASSRSAPSCPSLRARRSRSRSPPAAGPTACSPGTTCSPACPLDLDEAAAIAQPERHRDRHLHLGDDRPAQGRGARPREHLLDDREPAALPRRHRRRGPPRSSRTSRWPTSRSG